MSSKSRSDALVGVLVGLLLAAGLVLWWQTRGPSQSTVRKTVVTTIQEESPASFLVTGTIDLSVTVRIDSSQYLTPAWLTFLVEGTQTGASALLQGGAEAQVEVPGTVSYGFDVRQLTPEMVTLTGDDLIGVELPSLSVHSVEPALSKLRVRTQTSGWMRIFPSDAPDTVRTQALQEAQLALRTQALRQIQARTQPKVNTARAIKKMLRPTLEAAGIPEPRFRIQVGENLVLQPKG